MSLITINLHDNDRKIFDVINTIRNTSFDADPTTITDIKNTLCKKALDVFNILLHDIGKDPNNDTINEIRVDELINPCLALWELCDDFRKTFEEQLIDMTTGMCPQGRTVRLCQSIYFYIGII